MKNIRFGLANYLGLFIALLCAGNVLWLASCKEDVVGEGLPNPVIDQIRSLDSSATPVTATLAGTWLAVDGQNLLGTQKIYVNDYDVPFNTVYVTNNHIIFQLPDKVTSAATIEKGETLSNEIKIVTNHGTATHAFGVSLPPPTIYNLTNELGKSGTTISILGVGFLGISKVTFPGNIDVDFNMNKLGTAISVVVPDNAGIGAITISGPGLFAATDSVFNVRGYMLCNFEDASVYASGGGNDATFQNDATAFPGSDGYYAYMLAVGVGQWSWETGNTQFHTNPVEWLDPSLIGDSIENYALKFEYYLKTPWISGRFQICNNEWGADAYRYYWRQWDSTDPVVTPVSNNYWQTVSIPLTAFKNNDTDGDGGGAGMTAGAYASKTSPATFTDFLNGTSTTKSLYFKLRFYDLAVPKFEAAFDNFRIVKVK